MAEQILDAEVHAVTRLLNRGRPYARRQGRQAVADMDLAEIEIDTTISAGPHYSMEAPRFEGLRRVEEDYLLTYLNWEPGATYDQRVVDEYQRRLSDTRLFRAVSVRPPQEAPAESQSDITASAKATRQPPGEGGGLIAQRAPRWRKNTGSRRSTR